MKKLRLSKVKGNKNSLTILDMNQQDAQKIAREIAQKIELQLTEFFEKNAIEKFESIGEKFKTIDNPFDKLISEMIQEWKEFDVTPDSPFNFTYIDNALIDDLRYINKKYYQNFLFFGVLSSFFGRSSSPLFIQYRDELLKKHKLTPNKLKKALLDVFGYLLNNGKRGGSKGIWSKKKKLELLALYNRFLIVIKNARRDKRILKKKTNSELKIKKELIAKYEVPENLMPSLFSDDTPKDVALDWAIREMKLDKSNRDYLDKIILRNARKLWKNKGILIDVSIELGEHRFYGIRSEDKAIIKSQKDGLRYTRVCKNPKIGSIESEKDLKDFLKSENYLINFGFTRE